MSQGLETKTIAESIQYPKKAIKLHKYSMNVLEI